MATSGKAAATVAHAIARKRSASRSDVRSPNGEAVHSVSRTGNRADHRNGGSPVPQKPHADMQYQNVIRNFEIGVRAFQKQNYEKAAEVFEKLVDNDARDVAERAQVHLRLCRQRTRRAPKAPKSADEHYALGIACLNVRDLGQAVEHLSKADRIKPNQDHIQYALAVSRALEGNTDAAFAHLEVAFTLRPENRIHARRDEDFQSLSGDPRFRRLIYPASR